MNNVLEVEYECIGPGCSERFTYTWKDDNWGSCVHYCQECGTFNLVVCPANKAYPVTVSEVDAEEAEEVGE